MKTSSSDNSINIRRFFYEVPTASCLYYDAYNLIRQLVIANCWKTEVRFDSLHNSNYCKWHLINHWLCRLELLLNQPVDSCITVFHIVSCCRNKTKKAVKSIHLNRNCASGRKFDDECQWLTSMFTKQLSVLMKSLIVHMFVFSQACSWSAGCRSSRATSWTQFAQSCSWDVRRE